LGYKLKILITGCAGFIGSQISKKLLELGAKIDGIDDLSTGLITNLDKRVNFYNFDLSNQDELLKIKEKYDYILHLAGQSSGQISNEDPLNDLKRNVNTTVNLISYARRHPTRKIVYASSMSVYGDVSSLATESCIPNPKSFYGISKRTSEVYLKKISNEIDSLSLRMFNVYGPGQDMNNSKQGMVSIFLSQAMRSKTITVKGSLSRFRDFIFIDDVVSYWIKLTLNSNATGEVNIGTGMKTTVNDLVNIIKKIALIDDVFVTESTPDDQFGIVANTDLLNKYAECVVLTPLSDGLNKFYEYEKMRGN
jgi:UDP-glucose 4-epimerase